MPSPKRDVQHGGPIVPRRTTRPALPAKSSNQKNPVRSPCMVPLPLLPPAESGGRPPRIRPSPIFLQEPQPGRPLSPMRFSSVPPPLSTAALPRLVAEMGPDVAVGDCFWLEGPQMMASALGVHIPLSTIQLSCEESAVESVSDEDMTVEQEKPTAILNTARKTELRLEPLTAMEVVDIFMKKRHLGKLQFVHLKAMESGAYRPYDLRVVPHDRAGPEHYIFSPSSVLHVRDGCSVGFQTLGEWHREALLWNILQGLPFFRDFLLRKAFARWRRNMRRNLLRHARGLLQEQLLIAVPQFREALLQVSRLIEELKMVQWLPQDDSQTYTLQDFHSALMRKTKESQALLEKFLQYRSLILNMVQEDSYRAQQDLQQQVEQVQLNRPSQPPHLQRAHQEHLRQNLAQAESALQRLGNMAALVNHMTVQGLVTVAHREVTEFVRNVVTRSRPQQNSLFLTELVFGAEGELVLVAPVHLFQEALQGALGSVADSVLQVFDGGLSGSKDRMAPHPTLPSDNGVSGTMDPWGRKGELRQLMPRPVSPAKLALPNASTPRVEGQRLRGHYYPLSRQSLEWQLSVSVGEQEAQRDLARITQEALQEVERLCDSYSWLGDVHLSCGQWSSASLEAMRGWPSHRYREHIQRVQAWAERLHTLPACFTASNRLIAVRCSHIREKIAPQLASMEEEVLTLLQEEVRRRSEALVSELKTAADWLRAEPTDLDGFLQYASRVKECERLRGDLQDQRQYLQSLRETLRLNSRSMSPKEAALELQVQDNWNHFLPLLHRAGETVRQHTPSMTDTLDTAFSSLVEKLQGLVSQATSGPYTDPSQENALMVAQLQSIYSQFCTVAGQLEHMKETGLIIKNGGKPQDISLVAEERQKLEDRKGLWELLSVSVSYIHEWRQQLFSKFVVLRAQEKVDRWLQQAVLLERTVPPCDMVLKHVLQLLEGFSQQLPLLAELSSPALRHKHWRNIFKGMGLLHTPEWGMTVADLLSTNPLGHQNIISKVCQEARAEVDMEQAFRKLQLGWEGTLFRLANFLLTVWQDEEACAEPVSSRTTPDHAAKHSPRARQSRDSGTFIVIGLEALLSQTKGSVMTLSRTLLSPHVVEFRQEVERWVQQLQELEELLDTWKRYQLKWTYLSKIFHEFGVMTQKPELYQQFLPVDETYREMIQTMSKDPRVLNFVQLGHGQPGLRALLTEGLSAMEGISAQVLHLLDGPRDQFPRLCFLGDGEVMELLSLHPTPSSMLPLVRKCFQGVEELEIAYSVKETSEEEEDLPSTQPWVKGVFGGLGERVPFLCPVEPSLDRLAWLCQLEQQLHCAMVQLMADCAVARQRCQSQEGGKDSNQDQDQVQSQEGDTKIKDTLSLDPQHPCVLLSSAEQDGMKDLSEVKKSPSLWDLISGFPLQCLLVVEEALWCKDVWRAFLSPAPMKRVLLKAHYNSKLQGLCQVIRDMSVGRSERSVGSRRVAAALRAMVLLSIKHSQQLSGLMELKCELESSFEWQRLMKYHLSADDHSGPDGLTGVPVDGDSMELSCYVDILSSRLAYGYEYLSPEHWTMVNTIPSDRATLGILLALTCYRCGFVTGPCMSGKTETVVHLGQALGRHVVTLHCCLETSAGVVLQMLLGALQTGAWLLLDSADSMSQGALSLLGQYLSDIHHCFSFLLSSKQQQPGKSETEQHEQTAMPRDSSEGSTESVELRITIAGKTVSSKPGYGCILLSSTRQAIEVPENLRMATRPVSLVQPDYRVIAEATLSASGFSEAASMSRRLVSLFSLAKDSACLPESICAGPTSWLVLLNRVLTFAGKLLNQSLREKWEKDKVLDGDPEAQKQLLDMVLRAPEGLEGRSKGTCTAKFRRTNQSVVVLQAIAEEQAVIKAVTLAVASVIVDPRKTCHFHTIFEEIFPGSRCPPYHLQAAEKKRQDALMAAVVEELQEAGLHPSPCALATAMSLYQAMELSQAVVLVGLTGSGKTTCYRALAGALRKLAGRAAEERPDRVPSEAAEGTGTEALSPALTWSSIDKVVIFPNALSIQELWGGFSGPQGSWRDGALTKELRGSQELSATESPTTGSSTPPSTQRSQTRVGRIHTAKWLVLDGEPLGRPGWLDPLYSLCDPKDPFLCLPTGEKLRPPSEELKVLIEATALEDASPAAMTRCGLVHHSAEELWRAVWKAELEALNRDPTLDNWCLGMWSRLADDLFARTLTFLREMRLSPVLPEHGAGAREVTHGLQEVVSFSRVLCALKEQFGRNRLKAACKHTDKREGTSDTPQKISLDLVTPSAQQELQARNVFVVAYIWGFGGHLHPRHWPHFDEFARSALYDSRYRVVVPAEASVFEYFVHLNDGPVETHSALQSRSLQMSYSTIPQYERYVFLLRLMLKAHQPALLVGEVGSGKTTLCHSALGPKQPHLRLPTGALLRAADLRALLQGVACQTVRLDAMVTVTRQPGLLLFLDDLHDAPYDALGKASMALETLRQCMSTGGVHTSGGQHLRLCSSGALSFLATCDAPAEGGSSCAAVSPRLSRLFSILALPGLSADLVFSVHSPRLQLWLNELPSVADMAYCIVTATLDLYSAVRQAFPPDPDRPHFLFSPHDLRKVFQGMCLWRSPWGGDARCLGASRSSSVATALVVVRLWAHECLRTFGDRLCAADERGELLSLLAQVSQRNFGSRLSPGHKMDDKQRESNTPNLSAARDPGVGEEETSSSGEESTASSLEEEDEDRTESGGQGEVSDKGSSSCVSGSLSEEEALSEIPSEEPDMESVNYRESVDGTLSSLHTLSETSRTPSALRPSPPKEARPQSKPDRKRSGKLVVQLPQCTSVDRAVEEPLHNLEASLPGVVFGPDLSGLLRLQARLHTFKCDSAYKEQELEALVMQLAAMMKLKEEEKGKEKYRYNASYGVHRQGARQLAHVLRTLLLPGGHGVLFGAAKGTGRKTTVRLAAQLMGYRLLEVHSGNEAAVWEMLKEASDHVGVRRGGLVLLVHESASQVVREELLVAMANRTFPRLYSYKEWKVNNLVKGPHRHEEDHRTERYFRQVQWNVHVVLLMQLAPGGECPGVGGCMARALRLCSCVEVYQPWTTESLTGVAAHHLKSHLEISNLNTKVDRPCLVSSLSQAMAGMHQSARRYASVLTPDLQPFGPQTFMEFMSHFLYLCALLYDEGQSQANRMAAILGRMTELTEQAEQYSQEVLSLKTEFSEAQQRQSRLQDALDASRNVCERARQHCLLEENRLAHLEEQLQQARQLSQDALQQVSPLYQAALAAMQSLSQSDLEELRRYRRPPEGVMAVMDVICMLFSRPSSWESSQQLLGRPNFLEELEFYDRSALSGELLWALTEVVGRPGFQPEAVREVSRACESLCRWARAVHQYAIAHRSMAPHEARRAELEAHAAETRARLRDARLQEEAARARLEEAERRLQEARRATEELAARLQQAKTREREAAAAVQQVAPHTADWNAVAQEIERNTGTVPGDALTLAAALAYLGPFGPDARAELQGKWRELCLTGRIDVDPEDPRTVHLSAPPCPPPPTSPYVPIPLGEDPQVPMAWLMGGVQGVVQGGGVQGVAPARLLNLLLWGYRSPRARHWPLLADAHQCEGIVTMLSSVGQLSEGKSQVQGENEYDLEVSADDPALLDKLRRGEEKGLPVLVTHVERARPTPGFLELLRRRAGTAPPGPPLPAPPAAQLGFSLFLSTPLPLRALIHEIHPSILAEVQVVDLSLSGAELQEIMLTEMVQSKCPQIWSQNCQARTEKQMLLDRLHQQEVSLMDYVLQSSAPLLPDPRFLPRVSACRNAISGLREELLDLDQELERHRPLLARFHGEAELVAAFYRALQDMARLSPLYLFPLRRYLPALREALALQETPDVTYGGLAAPGGVSVEVLVSHLMACYRPCLFQSHAGLLRLLVSVALCHRGEARCEAERAAFLRGLGDEGFPGPAQSAPGPPTPPTQLPNWIPPAVQREVHRLESLPSFGGLASSLASCSEQWVEYLRYPSSTVIGPVPCPSHSHLSVLQRALLWKTLLPHWLAAVADDLAACQLGKPFQTPLASVPHPGTPEALSQLLDKTEGPVVLLLPGPSEPGPPPVHPLHWVEQAAQDLAGNIRVKKVQVISFGARCQREVVLAALDLAVQEGHWLVFNNCHSLDQWDEEVVWRLTQLVSCTDRGHVTEVERGEGPTEAGACGETQVHPCFRLWFITRAHTPLSIPAAVRTSALRLVCDSPWDLKEALRCSLRQAASSALAAGAALAPRRAGPLLRCAVLHAVLLQRRTYGHLGQRSAYGWIREDLQALVEAQVRTASHCHDPVGALEYIAGSLVYGGHVEDPADLVAVKGVATACLRPPPPLWGRGPHTLSELVARGRFGRRDLLQDLEQRVQASSPSGDPLLLGLSAGLAGELVRLQSHTLHLLLRDSQTSGVWPQSPALPHLPQAQDRLQALRGTLRRTGGSRVTPQTPLGLFLQQEWESLVQSAASLHTPHPTLGALSRLEARAELLAAYLWKESPETPPYAYRLSAFHNPRGFLAALLREAARAKLRDASRLSLHFQVLSAGTVPVSVPQSGAYLCGLDLQGALWDTRLTALQDTLSPKPCPLPLVWVRALSRAPERPGCSSALPLYHCPLYLYGEFGEGNIVTHLPLPAKLDPVLCALRPVRLVSTL